VDSLLTIYDVEEKGHLTKTEFEKLLIENMSDHLSEKDFLQMYELADLNSDTFIDKEELFMMYKILLRV
jgi:Ca2+-binding EF-hand superfamily protein